MRKVSFIALSAVLLSSIFTVLFVIQPSEAWTGTVYIRANGSVDPADAPINRAGDFYSLVGNISGRIVVEKNNTIIEGAGFTVGMTTGIYRGIQVSGVSNVTIQNMTISGAQDGVYGQQSSDIKLTGNNIVENAEYGVNIADTTGLVVVGNNISMTSFCGLSFSGVFQSEVYHNNFINNSLQVMVSGSITWDDGYPSGGNYWSDYTGTDVNGDGIGDAAYVIDADNRDRYPLINPYGTETPQPLQTYYLTIESEEINGTTNPAPGIYNYTSETSVSVTGIPDSGYEVHWILDGVPAGSDNPKHVLMNQNHTLKAFFQRAPFNTDTPIYIRADGSIDPSTAPIERIGDLYIIIGEIISQSDGIIVERNNMTLDGSRIMLECERTNNFKGVVLNARSNLTIRNMAIAAFSFGVYLSQCSNVTLTGNYLKTNAISDIYVVESPNIHIVANDIRTQDGEIGISLKACSYNDISKNTLNSDSDIVSGDIGVYLADSCSHNVVSDNYIADCDTGIVFSESSENRILENHVSDNRVNAIWIDHSQNSIVSGNNVTTTKEGAGIQLTNSSGITVSGNYIFRNADLDEGGVRIEGSSDISVQENNISDNNGNGMNIIGSSNVRVIENTIWNNHWGVWVHLSSSHTTVANNIIADNEFGIGIRVADHSRIVGNSISEGLGIWLAYSSENVIYHNELRGRWQVRVENSSSNLWDNGYPSGGNYWKDYVGTDLYNGADQNQDGSDGFGDTPCMVDANNIDRYPLLGLPSEFNVPPEHSVLAICNSTISDFQFNGTAIKLKVTGENGTTGFCRICIPTALLSGEFAVLIDNKEVSFSLLPCSNSTHSYLYFVYSHSTHEAIIASRYSSTLVPPMFIAAILLAVTATALFIVIIYKRRHFCLSQKK